ncbi:MAG TPA: glycosyltransferase [Vicinamibacterales bacterium]|nr:glycosyltransferase [Vicinamibacterales bacterium]
MTPAVSVVIPCFNQGQFLCDAIASARANTLQPEIIVVDDGSTEEISAITRTAGVTCIRQQNQGVVAARNRGLNAAHGEFIVFLDADDRLLPAALDTGAAALTGDPDCALVWGRCVMMDEAGSLLDTPVSPRVGGDAHAAFLRNNYIWTPAAAMLRTSIVREAGGFAHGFDAAADYDLYLRVTRHHRACDLGQAVAGYRRHGGNMSGSAALMLRDTQAVMRRHKPHDARLIADWRAGCAMWRDFYGTQLVEEMRRDYRQGAMSDVVTKALTLARLAPGVLWREARKKAALTAAKI